MEHKSTISAPAAAIPPSVLGIPELKRMSAPSEADKRAQLVHELREWWGQETADWDLRVQASRNDITRDTPRSDLWDCLPTLDSKTVARMSPIFQRHLGRPLDVKLIRPGGYESLEDMIGHLVPAMMKNSEADGESSDGRYQ